MARRKGESEAVAHAIEAHHNEVAPKTVEAVIVQIADAVSGARPGARGEALEHYVTRLRDLEEIAGRHPGRRARSTPSAPAARSASSSIPVPSTTRRRR